MAGAGPEPARTGFPRRGLVAAVCRAMVVMGLAWTSCSEVVVAAELRRKPDFRVRWEWALPGGGAGQTTLAVLGVSSVVVVAAPGSPARGGKEGLEPEAAAVLLPARAAVDSVLVGAVVHPMHLALGAVAAALGWAARFSFREAAPS